MHILHPVPIRAASIIGFQAYYGQGNLVGTFDDEPTNLAAGQ